MTEVERPPIVSAPRVGVGLIILNAADELLLSLRKRAPEAGLWSIVGGTVEYMERLGDTARREAREETGLEVELVRLLCVTDHILPEEDAPWVAPAYLARSTGGTLHNAELDRTAALRFFPLTALPDGLTLTARSALSALSVARS